MNEMERIAPEILKDFGADFSGARRAGGWTNHVWIAGDLVLRVSPDAGGDRIRREAALGMRLPGAVGYPEVHATGVTDGHEWSVSRRIPGVNLGEAWPEMTWEARGEAVRTLWAVMEGIHSAECADLVELPRRTWYSALEPAEARAFLDGLARRGALDDAQLKPLLGILEGFFYALARADRCLCHGDLTMENMMWDGGRIASVFDFEHAALLPAQADVYSFLRFALGPGSAEGAPAWFIETATGLAKRRVANRDEAALLLGFAALISIRRMHIWLDGHPGEDFADWEPYLSLVSLAGGGGGFLRPVVGELLERERNPR